MMETDLCLILGAIYVVAGNTEDWRSVKLFYYLLGGAFNVLALGFLIVGR